MIIIEEMNSCKDYGRALKIDNSVIETVVTLDIGPRIIFFGFSGGQNIMCDDRKRFGNKTDTAYNALTKI